MWRRTVVFCLLALALNACAGGNALQAEKLKNVSPDDLQKQGKALVFLSGELNDNNFLTKSGRLRIPLTWMHLTRDAGTNYDRLNATHMIGPGMKLVGGSEIGDGGVRGIPAGKYALTTIAAQDKRAEAPFKGPFFATVEVEAGEVLYLGHLIVVTQTDGPLLWGAASFKIGIESREADAREYLRQKFPQFAERMKARLMTINPELKLTEPPPAADVGWGAKKQ